MSTTDNHRFFKKPSQSKAVHNAEYHAPCPRCYTDCSPPVTRNGVTLTFRCGGCGTAHDRQVGAARTHTGWLLTRGSISVQVALRTNQE